MGYYIIALSIASIIIIHLSILVPFIIGSSHPSVTTRMEMMDLWRSRGPMDRVLERRMKDEWSARNDEWFKLLMVDIADYD